MFGGLIGVVGMVIGVPIFAVFYAFVARFVRKRLEKKGMPLDTTPYMDAVDVLPLEIPQNVQTENNDSNNE